MEDMNVVNEGKILIKIIIFDWKKGTRGVLEYCEKGVRDGCDNE